MVARGLASSRSDARRAIADGVVRVDGVPEPKAATMVATDQAISLVSSEPRRASRGGVKLADALDRFDIDPSGGRALDVGASTGGFTEVLLERGAAEVVALDVGYGQIAWHLRQDPRVVVVERTNFRTVDPSTLGDPFDLIVVDVSFIGVGLLAPNLTACGRPGTVMVVLVKPQFEVGRERVGSGGIVRDPDAHRDAISGVVRSLAEHGLGTMAAAPSPILGAKGNREFLLHVVHGAPGRDPASLAFEAGA